MLGGVGAGEGDLPGYPISQTEARRHNPVPYKNNCVISLNGQFDRCSTLSS